MPNTKHDPKSDPRNSPNSLAQSSSSNTLADNIKRISDIIESENRKESLLPADLPLSQGPYYYRRYYYHHHHPRCNHEADCARHYSHIQRQDTDKNETSCQNFSTLSHQKPFYIPANKLEQTSTGRKTGTSRNTICEEITQDSIRVIGSTVQNSSFHHPAQQEVHTSDSTETETNKNNYFQKSTSVDNITKTIEECAKKNSPLGSDETQGNLQETNLGQAIKDTYKEEVIVSTKKIEDTKQGFVSVPKESSSQLPYECSEKAELKVYKKPSPSNQDSAYQALGNELLSFLGESSMQKQQDHINYPNTNGNDASALPVISGKYKPLATSKLHIFPQESVDVVAKLDSDISCILRNNESKTLQIPSENSAEINVELHNVPSIIFRLDKSQTKERYWLLQILRPGKLIGKNLNESELSIQVGLNEMDCENDSKLQDNINENKIQEASKEPVTFDQDTDIVQECPSIEPVTPEVKYSQKTPEERIFKLEAELSLEIQRRNLLSKYMRIIGKQIMQIQNDISAMKNKKYSPFVESTLIDSPIEEGGHKKSTKKNWSKLTTKQDLAQNDTWHEKPAQMTLGCEESPDISNKKHKKKYKSGYTQNKRTNSQAIQLNKSLSNITKIADSTECQPSTSANAELIQNILSREENVKKPHIALEGKEKSILINPKEHCLDDKVIKTSHECTISGMHKNMILNVNERSEQLGFDIKPNTPSTSLFINPSKSKKHTKYETTNKKSPYVLETAAKIDQCIQEILDKFQKLERRTQKINFRYFE